MALAISSRSGIPRSGGQLPGDATLFDVLRRWAARCPDAPALSAGGRTRTWAQIHERVSRIAQGMLADGVGPGDRIAHLSSNGAEYFELGFAAAAVGAVLSAVNWRLAPPEIVRVLQHAEVTVLFAGPDQYEAVASALPALTSLRRVVMIGAAGTSERPCYESWLASFPPRDPELSVAGHDPVVLTYTSGTTGRPKGALFTHAAVQATWGTAALTGIHPDSVVLIAGPVFHAFGSLCGFLGLANGAHLVVSAAAAPEEIFGLVERYRVTAIFLVPTILRMLVDAPGGGTRDTSSVHTIAYAGSPMPPGLQRTCLRRFGCRFVQLYGLTETNNGTALDHDDHFDPVRRDSVGRQLPGVEVRVVDPAT